MAQAQRQPIGWDASGTPVYAEDRPQSGRRLKGYDESGKPVYEDDAPKTQPYQPPGVIRAAETVGRGISDVALGAGKRLVDTAVGLGGLIHKIPGVSSVTDALYGMPAGSSQASFREVSRDLQPTSTAQKAGGVLADVGTALVPAAKVTQGAQALAKLAPRGLGVLSRGAVEAGGQAAIAAGQGYDPTLAGVVGGVAGTASGATRALRGALKNPNAVEREALEYVTSQGVPVDAATLSGNAGLKGAKYLADKSLAGSLVAGKELQKESKGLATLGEQLAAKASPSTATALSAGSDLRDALTKRIKDLHAEANTHYDELRNLEAANVQRVITGTGPSKTGVVRAVTQTATMGFPVQLKPVKAALQPIYDRITRQMPPFQQQASPALKALENLIKGPDIAPASVVDADLSALKSIARGADMPELRDISQGIAAKAVSELDAAVQRAVSQGGTKALTALQAGRKATRAKYLTSEILDDLNREPAKAFRQATERGDASIMRLRELQKLAPNEVPKLGRAYLDDMLEKATSEGGFKGAQGMATQWQALGPETKKLLFPKAGLTEELDKFFLAAKRLAENPNPSGSGGVVSIGAQTGAIFLDPLLGVSAQALGAVTSKLLRNPSTVRLLTQGMKAPKNSMTAQALKLAITRALSERDEQ